MFQTNVVEKSKTILCSIFFVEKYCIAMRATDDNMMRHTEDATCMPDN